MSYEDPLELVAVSIYRQDTGAIVSLLTCEASMVELNTPVGHAVIDGHHNPLNRKVNLQTLEVEAYQPAAPDADHVWNATTELWELPAAVKAARADRINAQRRIDYLEYTQARKIRELTLGRGGNQAQIRAMLEAIDDEIVTLRSLL